MKVRRLLVERLFGRYLFVTNTVSCSALLGLGDCLQQTIERLSDDAPVAHDWGRTGRMWAIGLILGPMAHGWYTWLDRHLPTSGRRIVLRKILYDQFCAAPVFSFTFINGMNALEGRPVRRGLSEFREKFPTIYMVDWCIWPPTQALNFYVIPKHFRALYVYFVDLVWYTFNSYMKHRDQTQPHLPEIPKQERDVGSTMKVH